MVPTFIVDIEFDSTSLIAQCQRIENDCTY